jgi:hypothetical protein
MPRRPPSRPRLRSLLRLSQQSRSEQQAFVHAYELALPVLRASLAGKPSAERATPESMRRRVPQTLVGG